MDPLTSLISHGRQNFSDLNDLPTVQDVLARLFTLWHSKPRVRGLQAINQVKDEIISHFQNTEIILKPASSVRYAIAQCDENWKNVQKHLTRSDLTSLDEQQKMKIYFRQQLNISINRQPRLLEHLQPTNIPQQAPDYIGEQAEGVRLDQGDLGLGDMSLNQLDFFDNDNFSTNSDHDDIGASDLQQRQNIGLVHDPFFEPQSQTVRRSKQL